MEKFEVPNLIYFKKLVDDRGWFTEFFNEKRFNETLETGIHFIQSNMSFTYKGVARGLHWQEPPYAQTKLVTCVDGFITDFVVDIRPDSPNYGKVYEYDLTSPREPLAAGGIWLYVPKGFAHGFVAHEPSIVQYMVDAPWNKESERGLNFKKTINNHFFDDIHLSERDEGFPELEDIKTELRLG